MVAFIESLATSRLINPGEVFSFDPVITQPNSRKPKLSLRIAFGPERGVAVVHAQLIKSSNLDLQTPHKVIVVTRTGLRPGDFCKRTQTRQRHIVRVLEGRYVFSPQASLSTNDVGAELRLQTCRHRLKGISLA